MKQQREKNRLVFVRFEIMSYRNPNTTESVNFVFIQSQKRCEKTETQKNVGECHRIENDPVMFFCVSLSLFLALSAPD